MRALGCDRGPFFAAALALALLTSAGCAPTLMRTPTLYLSTTESPWATAPPELRTTYVDLLYATDRVPTQDAKRGLGYGIERSLGLGFGECRVELGRGLTWEELEQRSLSYQWAFPVELSVEQRAEQGRFPPTPWPPALPGDRLEVDPAVVAAHAEAERRLQQLVSRRLAQSPRKEAFVFVHGFNTQFDEAAIIMAELWHFLGREGVPILYSWPAGSGLGVRGYNYDRESGEFTVYHLKQFLNALAHTPDLQRIHLIAHSRGADVLTSALRELVIHYRAKQPDDPAAAAKALKIGHLVLAAPDLDLDVAKQRLAAERIGGACETLTCYSSPDDLAITIAKWLFISTLRLGTLGLADLREDERTALARLPGVAFIDARVSADVFGHSYFYQNPAVSSDLILLLRDNCRPGAEHGRPLTRESGAFWRLSDDYLRQRR